MANQQDIITTAATSGALQTTQRLWTDIGSGNVAENVYIAGGTIGPVTPAYVAPATWATPTSNWDGRAYGNITIWCWTAPSTPYTITAGDGTNMIAQTPNLNNSTGFSNPATISAVGRYVIQGNCYVALSGGSGGSFSIAGSQ